MADANISRFIDITGVSAPVAQSYLEMANGDMPLAVQLYYDTDLQHSINSSATPPAMPSTGGISGHQQRGVRERDDGIIEIDSDDDSSHGEDFRIAERNAQTKGDEAEARRLQQREYLGAPGATEGVRSPIQATTETLVGPGPILSANISDHDVPPHSIVYPPQQTQQRTDSNPFSQNPWEDSIPSPASDTQGRNLAEMYKPPRQLLFKGSWDEAREEGKRNKKWILVNVQKKDDFNCQILDRDVWKNDAIKELIRENFIFLQYIESNIMARDYLNFYFRDYENIESYPHVAIVDPRTGEQVKVWSGIPFPGALDLHSQLAEFLDRYSLEANSKNPVVKSKPRQPQPVDFDRMTEEEMLEMALKNSLANGGGTSDQPPRIEDPDALTKSPRPEEGAENTEEPSRFASISSTNPHTEPEHDPAVTTRIQFRHPNGRIIRRFNAQDPVRRLFEWLKAEPMEGKEGLEFELKRMPQGQDLIEGLDQTIEEAGLKQGTVMIEFLD